jgi:succinate dehydrogenase / fumarate reductase flavoprotein subunit
MNLLKNGKQGKHTVLELYRSLGKIVWDKIGMARNAHGLKQALQEIPALRDQFWSEVIVPGSGMEFNKNLEVAGRVADFFELAELMARDALAREESCGGHFREEYQTSEGEAARDDARYCHVAAWEYGGPRNEPVRHVESLEFENVKLSQRSYK